MSTSAGLREASRLLAATLRAAFLADTTLGPLFTAGGHVVSLRTPREMRTGTPTERGVSVWLYHVQRHSTLANRPPERVSPSELRQPPLPVTLHYLLTALSGDGENEQLILGKVLQVLNDHRVLPPDPARPDLDDTLRVHLEPLDLEGITRGVDRARPVLRAVRQLRGRAGQHRQRRAAVRRRPGPGARCRRRPDP
jgi:hypothetical protein